MPVLNLSDFDSTGRSPSEQNSEVIIPEDTLAGKNYNPGNLRFAGQAGAIEGEGGFAKFESPEAGFGALRKQIALDAGRGHTLESFINKYAPPTENDTTQYVENLRLAGFDPAANVVDLDQEKLAQEMAKLESGTRFGQAEVAPVQTPRKGLNLADFTGVQKAPEQVSEVNPLAQGTPEKGSTMYDYLYGSLVELPRDVIWGAVTWPVAQIVRHGAVAGQKIQQQLGLVEKMTPEQQAKLGENAANWIMTLGGLATPTTETAKASEEIVGKIIEPIQKLAEWSAQGINPEKHPNLHNLAATGVEFGLFASVPKVGKGLKRIAKKRVELSKLKKKAKTEKALEIVKEQEKLLKETEEKIAKGELDELIAERQSKNQQLIAGAEGFSAIDLPGKQLPAEVIPTKSELSQTGRGFEGGVRRPDLGKEPVSRVQTGEPVVPERIGGRAEIQDVLPRTESVLDPITGERVTTKIGAKKEYQITPGEGVKLVEEIPGRRQVYQILLDPLKNESGAIDLTPLKELFGKAPKGMNLFNQLIKKGISAEDLMLSGIGGYLKEQGQKRIDWGKVKKIADEGGFDVEKKSLGTPGLNKFDSRELNTLLETESTLNDFGRLRLEALKNKAKMKTPTKYGPEENPQYNLPGHVEGSYKENLFKFDPKEGSFKEDHWGEAGTNVMAHSRQHDRTVGGNNAVYVDEVQSKWHDEGKRLGYDISNDPKIRRYQELDRKVNRTEKEENEFYELQAELEFLSEMDDISEPVPNAPFKKSWHKLVMRDAIADAVQRNKDGISWSTGKIQQERWPGQKTDYGALYDKKIPKFFENEFGVKPEKVKTTIGAGDRYQVIQRPNKLWAILDTNTGEIRASFMHEGSAIEALKDLNAKHKGLKEVWYAPITAKMRKIFGDPAVQTAIDHVLAPLRNEGGFIRIPNLQSKLREKLSPELRERVRSLGKRAEDAGLSLKEYLTNQGIDKEQVNKMVRLHEQTKIERPMRAGLEQPKASPKDFDPFSLREGETRLNVGEDANRKIQIGDSDINALPWEVPGRAGVASYFKPAEFMFDRYKRLKPLLHQAREIEATIKKELTIGSKHLKNLVNTFSDVKARREAGAAWHALSSSGRDAMQKMGVEVNPKPKYLNLQAEMQPLFEDLFTRINEARVKIGKRPIPKTENYLAFFAKESIWTDLKNLVKGKEVDMERTNLVLDDLATISQRQAQPIKDSVAFPHLKRRGLDKGVELELDPMKIYARYLNDSLRHIHMSPLNAFIKELISKELIDPKTGEGIKFSKENPNAAAEIGSWNNKLAGMSNAQNIPITVEKLLNKGMKNLTIAQLFANARTSAVQTVAMFPTAVKFGYANTAKGIADMVVRKKNAPVEKSSALQTAVMDAAVEDMGRAVAGTKLEQFGSRATELAGKFISWPDYLAREATFRTAWNSLEPLVKKGVMTEREAIRLADSEVIRTQGSGSPVELSPIQRNVIGKMATLWQTFTINHINFIAKDVLGIKNPEVKPRDTAVRVMRYVGGMVALNALFEQVVGVQSPLPAPEQTLIRGLQDGDLTFALILKTLLEVAEAFPFGGSVKFGSSPVGPLVEHANDIAQALAGTTTFNPDMLDRAIAGDKRATVALGELVGKTLGVPGTAQVAKYVRGRDRGESIPRALIGRIGKPTKGSSKRTNRKRISRRRKR